MGQKGLDGVHVLARGLARNGVFGPGQPLTQYRDAQLPVVVCRNISRVEDGLKFVLPFSLFACCLSLVSRGNTEQQRATVFTARE